MKFKKEFKDTIKILCKKYNISLFILFGSRAKGKEKETSDYDFAYFPSKNITAKQDIKIFETLMKLLNYEKIDLINIKNAKDYITINNIFQTGIPIYEREKGLFKEMKFRAFITYNNFKPYYDEAFELSKKKLKEMIKDE